MTKNKYAFQMDKLPTFAELAAAKLEYAGPRDKTINVKVSINTARMMIESESKILEALRLMEKQISEICPQASTLSYARAALECAEDDPRDNCMSCGGMGCEDCAIHIQEA